MTRSSQVLSARSARISHRSYDRTTLAGARMIAATAGALLISSAGFPLVRFLGDGDERSGFFHLAILAGSVAVIFHLICFASTREHAEPGLDTPDAEHRYRLGDLYRIVASNTAFLYLLAMIPLFSAAAAFLQKSLVYYVKYGLQTHDQQHVVLFVHGLTAMLATPLWAYVAHRLGRRSAWIYSTALMFAAAVMFTVTPGTLPAFLLLPMSVGFAAMGVLFWSMLPDTVEFGQWRSGFRAESAFFGVASFTQKMSIGIAGWLMGGALAMVGFVPDAEQSSLAILVIRSGLTLVPAVLLVFAVLIVMKYPLNSKLHHRIRRELLARETAD